MTDVEEMCRSHMPKAAARHGNTLAPAVPANLRSLLGPAFGRTG